jgi:hypothetical protein
MRISRHTEPRGALHAFAHDSFHQAANVGDQAGDGVLEFYPGRQPAEQVPLRFLVGESSQPSHVAPVCAGQISLIEKRQVPADESGDLRRQRFRPDRIQA